MHPKAKSERHPLLPLVTCCLLAASAAVCACGSGRSAGETPPPAKPSLTPGGPDLTLGPGMVQSLRASSTGAVRFEWTLQGLGTISSSTGETIAYTAPDQAGAMAIVTVTALNQNRASAQSSISISTSSPPAVRLDALGIPAGLMSGAHDPSSVITMSASPVACHTGADCVQARYRAGSTFAGVVWWPTSCGPSGTPGAWQRARSGSCAIDVLAAGHLRTVTRMTFWARGERGQEVIEFKVGDTSLLPSPGRSSGLLTLTPTWKQYTFELADLDLHRTVGLFMWVAADLHNPNGATFYLDDVQFEGTR